MSYYNFLLKFFKKILLIYKNFGNLIISWKVFNFLYICYQFKDVCKCVRFYGILIDC